MAQVKDSVEPILWVNREAAATKASAAGDVRIPGRTKRFPVSSSIHFKILAVCIPAIILVNLLISGAVAIVQFDRQMSELQEKRTVLLSTQAHLIAPELQGSRTEAVALHLAQFATDNDVVEAIVYDSAGYEVTRAVGHHGHQTEERHSWPIVYAQGTSGTATGQLVVTFSSERARDKLWDDAYRGFTLAVFSSIVLGLLIVFVTHRLIGKPLNRIAFALDASLHDGRRHLVDWKSDDEFGRLASAFNRMQNWLDLVDADNSAFQSKLERFYHGTPVMLHSVDEEGILQQVSTHWCVETGYARDEALGEPLTQFLTDDSAELYRSKILPNYIQTGQTDETPLQFVCRDGRVMDVLLAEARESDQNIPGSPSLSVMTDISKIKLAERELEKLVATDSVTGLFNRRGFLNEVEKAIHFGGKATIAFVDLDRFKRINDTYGHPAGDRLLMAISARLKTLVSNGGFAGRLGGDEFALYIPDISDDDQSEMLAKATLEALRQPVSLGTAIIEPSGSVGFARFPNDGENSAELIIAADLALYRAKHSGRDRVERFDERLRLELAERREQENDIREALANDWFIMHLQPIVRLHDGKIVGGEALARLNHPGKGLISPARFIKAAEENGSIDAIGRIMLRRAISVIPQLIEVTGNPEFYLSINLSGGQVRDDLPNFIQDLMAEFGVKSSNVVLEIIETALFDDTEKANEILTALSRLGVRFALDDFGTGFSSLNYVQQFPVSMIKIDRSYTRCLRGTSEDDRRIAALVRTCVTLGNELGLPIVAEGIELIEELEGTQALGVELGQGYLFSPPLKVASFVELVTVSAGSGAPRAYKVPEPRQITN